MNWRVPELDNRAILSFSDAHSGPKLGREATIFTTRDSREAFSYRHVWDAVTESMRSTTNPKTLPPRTTDGEIAYTLEFYPEEGKYHYTGHRACNIRYTPTETKERGSTCPVCGKGLTVGVMERVETLAGRSEEDLKLIVERKSLIEKDVAITMTRSGSFPNRPPFVMMVPLAEIIAESIGSPVTSKKVWVKYHELVDTFGGEFTLLLGIKHDAIAEVAGARIAEGIERVRSGNLHIDPGYDGVFGVVKLWQEGEETSLVDKSKEQLRLL
jgi:PHP family Zn ribbon phosphoesterase